MKKIFTFMFFISLIYSQDTYSQKFPTLGEIYNFNPGDEFHSLHYYCYNELSFQLKQITILDKFQSNEKIMYCIQENLFDFIHTQPPTLVDTTYLHHIDTLIIESPDSIIFGGNDAIHIDPMLYNGREICIHTFWILNALKEERYVAGCGLVFNGWYGLPGSVCDVQDSLIFYSKGNESWGNSLLRITARLAKNQILIFPNPVTDILQIKCKEPDITIRRIEISDVTGKIILSSNRVNKKNNRDFTLECKNFNSGIYFIYFSTNKGAFSHRFVKF